MNIVEVNEAKRNSQRSVTRRATMERRRRMRSGFDRVENEFRERYEELIEKRNRELSGSFEWFVLHAKANTFFEAAVRVCEEKRLVADETE